MLALTTIVLCEFASFSARQLTGGGDHSFRLIGSYYASGWAASHHLDPYASYPLTYQFNVPTAQHEIVINDINLSPPAMLPLLEWIARFTIAQVAVAWTWMSTLFFVASAVLLIVVGNVQARVIVWLLFSRYVMLTLLAGEDYSFLLCLACLIWVLMRKGQWNCAYMLAGILIASKPNLGLWPILLLVTGRWKPAIVSSVTAAVVSLIPMLRYGPSVYLQWLRASESAPHWIFPSDVSLIGIFTRLSLRPLGITLAILCGVALISIVARLYPKDNEIAGIAICASILCAPLGWYHYAMLAAPFFVNRRWNAAESAAAFLIWLPPIYELQAAGGTALARSLMSLPHLAGVVWLLVIFLRRSRPSKAEDTSWRESGAARRSIVRPAAGTFSPVE